MFSYNRFWHFWHRLDNRYYARAAMITAALFLVAVGVAFPVVWAAPVLFALSSIVPALLTAGVMRLFKKASNFFYQKQSDTLEQLKQASTDELYKEQVDYYLTRHIVCPSELLNGEKITITNLKSTLTSRSPLTLETSQKLDPKERPNLNFNRNKAYSDDKAELFIKSVEARDGLCEIAAIEMAALCGLEDCVLPSAVSNKSMQDFVSSHQTSEETNSDELLLSREKIAALIATRKDVKNTAKVQDAVATFISKLKTSHYRRQAEEGKLQKLSLLQTLLPNAKDGLSWFKELYNVPYYPPGAAPFTTSAEKTRRAEERLKAKELLESIDQHSFEEAFLLQLILGSADANPGNTLFETKTLDKGDKTTRLYSIDHERIMPDDNYDVTKRMPIMNGPGHCEERAVEHVFPIRLWLAGLPQAELPFSRETLSKMLTTLDPERLAGYHRQKKLFSGAEVGAQLDRVQLIRTLFEKELNKDKITLSPKALFLTFVNNHPSYEFLKSMKLSDFSTFMLLGQIPEGADWSLIRHPLKDFQIWGRIIEMVTNSQRGMAPFSAENFARSAALYAVFYNLTATQQLIEGVNKIGLTIIETLTEQLLSKDTTATSSQQAALN
jgi:hypothetical protein